MYWLVWRGAPLPDAGSIWARGSSGRGSTLGAASGPHQAGYCSLPPGNWPLARAVRMRLPVPLHVTHHVVGVQHAGPASKPTAAQRGDS